MASGFEFDVRSGYFRKITTPLACDLTTDLSSGPSDGGGPSLTPTPRKMGTATAEVAKKLWALRDGKMSFQYFSCIFVYPQGIGNGQCPRPIAQVYIINGVEFA
jgi:hypothetical protein